MADATLDNYNQQRFSTLVKLVAAGIMVFRNHFKPPKLLKNLVNFSKTPIPSGFFTIEQRKANGTGGLGAGLIKLLNLARVFYQQKSGQDLTNVGFDVKERIISDYAHVLRERGLDQFWNAYGFSKFPKGENKEMITDYFNNVDDKDLLSILSGGATLQMPVKNSGMRAGYIHLRPGTMYHELDPMNVVFEIQRRSKWDEMPALEWSPIKVIYAHRSKRRRMYGTRLRDVQVRRRAVMGGQDEAVYDYMIHSKSKEITTAMTTVPRATGAAMPNYGSQSYGSSFFVSNYTDSAGDVGTGRKLDVYYYPTPSPKRVRFRVAVTRAKFDPTVMRTINNVSGMNPGIRSPERRVQGKTKGIRRQRTWRRPTRSTTTTTPKSVSTETDAPTISLISSESTLIRKPSRENCSSYILGSSSSISSKLDVTSGFYKEERPETLSSRYLRSSLTIYNRSNSDYSSSSSISSISSISGMRGPISGSYTGKGKIFGGSSYTSSETIISSNSSVDSSSSGVDSSSSSTSRSSSSSSFSGSNVIDMGSTYRSSASIISSSSVDSSSSSSTFSSSTSSRSRSVDSSSSSSSTFSSSTSSSSRSVDSSSSSSTSSSSALSSSTGSSASHKIISNTSNANNSHETEYTEEEVATTKPKYKTNRTVVVRYKPVTYIDTDEDRGKEFEFDNDTSDIWVLENGAKAKFHHPNYLRNPDLVLPGMVPEPKIRRHYFTTQWDLINFDSSRRNVWNESSNLKISSWNIGGMRAWLVKNGTEFLRREKPDIFCLQETRCEVDMLPEAGEGIPNYYKYWHNGDTTYFSGVAIFSLVRPRRVYYGLGTKEIDRLGLCMAAEFDTFFVVSVHFPYRTNKYVDRSSFTMKFTKFVNALDSYKPVIICGDIKTALSVFDIAHVTPSTAKTIRGDKEIEEIKWLIYSTELVDTFRYLYPTKMSYSCWPLQDRCRKRNRGWRSDYAFISRRIVDMVCDSVVRMDVYGAPHCPIALFVHVRAVEKTTTTAATDDYNRSHVPSVPLQ